MRLLFVCSGNLHRSVMAAAIARGMFEELKRPARIASAGTLNLQGQPAPAEVVTVCDELGLDVREHRSQGLTRSLLQSADAVIVMSDAHGEAALRLDPEVEDRLYYLGDWATPQGDIFDPIGQRLETFRASRDLILAAMQALLPTLLRR